MFRSLLAAAAMVVFLSAPAKAEPFPTGNYNSDWGPMTFACESFQECFATYENGQSTLYIIRPNLDAHYRGFWFEPQSDVRCEDTLTINGFSTPYWGRVEFVFSGDGEAWRGYWGYCDQPATGEWNGSR